MMDPYAQAAPQAGGAPGWGGDASWGMPAAAGAWGAPAPAPAPWGAPAPAPAPWGAPAPAPWGGDAWGGKGGKGGPGGPGAPGGKGGKGGKGKGMDMRFQPYQKKGGPTTSVKIQPLPEGCGENEIRETFSVHGEIQSVRIMQGTPNYAYVNYTTTSAAAAVVAINQCEFGGMKVWLNPGKPKYPDASEGIGIFNLPFATTQEELEKLLSGYPGFKKVKMIMKPGSTEFRGFCFADFDSVDSSIAALEGLTGQWVGDKAIDVKFSQQPGTFGGKGKGKGEWGGPMGGGGWGGPMGGMGGPMGGMGGGPMGGGMGGPMGGGMGAPMGGQWGQPQGQAPGWGW